MRITKPITIHRHSQYSAGSGAQTMACPRTSARTGQVVTTISAPPTRKVRRP
ncbi:hypothetical protein [Streptomyces sp. NPDC059861]|uniref:hypothetical protein n=1 Tax=Streptomyces sp. NPDC059861 TaxID=3346974 RepID=UPI003666C6BC